MASVTLNLPPDTERELRHQAHLRGQTLEAYLQHLAERAAHANGRAPTSPVLRPAGVLDYLDSLPAGPRSAPTWDEVERAFQSERDSWER
jgi:hypothetical protein